MKMEKREQKLIAALIVFVIVLGLSTILFFDLLVKRFGALVPMAGGCVIFAAAYIFTKAFLEEDSEE